MQLKNKWFFTIILFFITNILYSDLTHFQYVLNDTLTQAVPTKTTSLNDIKKWEALIQTYLNENGEENNTHRFYAYLYTAMRDVLFLSYQTKGYFAGSVDPIVLKMTQLFYPQFPTPKEVESDPYSEELARIVFAPYQERFKEENEVTAKEKDYALKTTRMLFWLLKNPIYPPPPVELQSKEGLARQISLIKSSCKQVTKKDQEQALYWAGELYPGSGNWLLIANQYMEKNNIAFEKQILVRSYFAMALMDGLIDATLAKYHYNFPRPPLKDPTLVPMLKLPKTPSYPSHHATEAFLSKTILTHYFPLEEEYFTELANQSALSRICAKVHYPLDREAGMKLGEEIGKVFIQKINSEPIDFKK